jgi:hypothetical protein
MEFFRTLLAGKIIFILGIISFVSALTLTTSCRWLPASRLFKKASQNKTFMRFYKLHSYVWWIFWPSVITHVIFVVIRLGIPF